MAMSLPGYGFSRANTRNLYCGVCRDVYRSPRLLPCHHTYCLECIKGLISSAPQRHPPNSASSSAFPCPQCRKSTPVPINGALGFQVNFYIPEAELELERNGPSMSMCPNHEEDPLMFFCVPCDTPICLRCKLTKHDHHETQDLKEAASRSQGQLEASKTRLNKVVQRLRSKLARAQSNLKAAQLKEDALIKEVHAQRDAVVSRVDRLHDRIVDDMKVKSAAMKDQLTQDTHNIQRSLDSCLNLHQRVHHAMTAPCLAHKLLIHKEMRDGPGSEQELSKVKDCEPVDTMRPGLHRDLTLLTDDVLLQWLGSAVRLSLPFASPMSDVITPICQCGQEGDCREVHDVCYVNEIAIIVTYGGLAPDFQNQTRCTVNEEDTSIGKIKCVKRKSHVQRYCNDKAFREDYILSEDKYCLKSKGFEPMFQLRTLTPQHCSVSKVLIKNKEPFKRENKDLFTVECGKPTAFDATPNGKLCVAVEEKITESCQETQRNILLFRHGESQPFTSYTATQTGFHPADVCFWQEEGEHKLLVADTNNDAVHVVRLDQNTCRFERYLAAGDAHLLRPTALDVDDLDRVWIGCSNGWILKCHTQPHNEEDDDGEDDMKENSTDGGEGDDGIDNDGTIDDESDDGSNDDDRQRPVDRFNPLLVENASTSTETQSQASTD